ncbi:TRM11 family methyltransferase [Pseudomonas helleri]|uniref:Uncharacterized protein n=1 Tax=Pseudomonas helleri TaxID=1608996 RepID=A0A7X1XJT4_9PSED|nr:hypothetical protein [Pseudomonas helleri]MQT92891.1 hypothetical protein [Pseudomonas helleri]
MNKLSKAKKIDFFETPSTVINWIAPHLNKEFNYYDPCVGRGQIPKILSNHNIKVIGSDIRENNIYGKGGVDFLNADYLDYADVQAFIMNPPFSYSFEFLKKCLIIAEKHNQEIWIFEKLSFLASKTRSAVMNEHLEGLYVCSRRPSMYAADENLDLDSPYIEKPMGGTIDFAWFKFKHKPTTKTVISLT